MKARRLTAQQAAKILAAFYEAYGPEVMKKAYSWSYPPAVLMANERMWAFVEDEDMVGWGSSILSGRDGGDTEAILCCGVFPHHQRKGYRLRIREWMAREAKRRGADRATVHINRENAEHHARVAKEVEGGRWHHAGSVWLPKPGYDIFTCFFASPSSLEIEPSSLDAGSGSEPTSPPEPTDPQ